MSKFFEALEQPLKGSPVTIRTDLLEIGAAVRHDPDKLGQVLRALARGHHTVRTSAVPAQA